MGIIAVTRKKGGRKRTEREGKGKKGREGRLKGGEGRSDGRRRENERVTRTKEVGVSIF